MTRLIRAEVFKLRTTNLWWLFALATVQVLRRQGSAASRQR